MAGGANRRHDQRELAIAADAVIRPVAGLLARPGHRIDLRRLEVALQRAAARARAGPVELLAQELDLPLHGADVLGLRHRTTHCSSFGVLRRQRRITPATMPWFKPRARAISVCW